MQRNSCVMKMCKPAPSWADIHCSFHCLLLLNNFKDQALDKVIPNIFITKCNNGVCNSYKHTKYLIPLWCNWWAPLHRIKMFQNKYFRSFNKGAGAVRWLDGSVSIEGCMLYLVVLSWSESIQYLLVLKHPLHSTHYTLHTKLQNAVIFHTHYNFLSNNFLTDFFRKIFVVLCVVCKGFYTAHRYIGWFKKSGTTFSGA